MKTHVCIARGPHSNFISEHQQNSLHTLRLACVTSDLATVHFARALPLEFIFHCEFSFLLARVSATPTEKNATAIDKKMWYNSCRLFNIHVAFFTQQANVSNNICSTLTEKYVFFNYTMCGVSQIFFAFFTKRNYYTNIS